MRRDERRRTGSWDGRRRGTGTRVIKGRTLWRRERNKPDLILNWRPGRLIPFRSLQDKK